MASPLQGGHWEATLFSPCYNWDWIKSCSIFSQSWQLSFFFFKWHLIPSRPPSAPPYHHSAGDTLEEGHAWEGDEKWMSGVVEECVRGQTPGLHISVPPPRTTVSTCLWQCAFHVPPGWWQSDRKCHTYSWILCATGAAIWSRLWAQRQW